MGLTKTSVLHLYRKVSSMGLWKKIYTNKHFSHFFYPSICIFFINFTLAECSNDLEKEAGMNHVAIQGPHYGKMLWNDCR